MHACMRVLRPVAIHATVAVEVVVYPANNVVAPVAHNTGDVSDNFDTCV